MVGKENLRTEGLNLCFEKLMMLAGGGDGMDFGAKGVKMDGGVIAGWKDIPMELLLQIVSLVDDRSAIVASGVCRGWRDAICFGLGHLSLSWYFLSSALNTFLFISNFDRLTSDVDKHIDLYLRKRKKKKHIDLYIINRFIESFKHMLFRPGL